MSSPAKAQNLANETLAHHRAGRLARAEAGYRQLLSLLPRETPVFEAYAQLLLQMDRVGDAIKVLQQALRTNERAVSCVVRLASALITHGRAAEAERVLRRSTQVNPRSGPVWNALAYALKVQGKLDEALTCHDQAVTVEPSYPEGWFHRGLTLATLGRCLEALESHERALAADPSYAQAHFGRAQSLQRICRLEEAILEYDAFLAAEPEHRQARSYRLFALQSLETLTPQELFQEHVAYGRDFSAPAAPPATLDWSDHRRLRVGILSPDLRTHSCAYFLEPLLQHLNPAEFELYLYHDHFQEDDVSQRLRAMAREWRNVVGTSAATLERIIREDAPDIMIDLAGHVGMTVRLPLFARRLAPVQVTYLGYPDTTGVPAMDYRFTDAIADPAGEADTRHTERLVRFAPTAWVYRPRADAPPVTPTPSLSAGPVTFGCFSSPSKFTDRLFATWAELLAAVPESRLLLKGREFEEPRVRDDFTSRMQRQGMPLDRIGLLPRIQDVKKHLGLYGQIDIVLDTFPYAGTTTTCEALWMGRPVVTLAGERHAARVGASLVTAIGHPEWIASSTDHYVAIAVGLASDRERLGTIAQGLRGAMDHSLLRDELGQSARFAAALRACWIEGAAVSKRGRAPAA
jgi:protein O-GlcNAc transferase